MTLKLAVVAAAFLPLVSFAGTATPSTQANPPAVTAFYRHPEHCAYMAGLPENNSPEFIKRFETDVQAAVEALRAANPSLSLTDALFHLKVGCDQALAKAK